jgi:uncharacterized protein
MRMRRYRIGVISDTHVPDMETALHPQIAGIFQDVDLIFHLGNITGKNVLAELGCLAAVVATRGAHDRIKLPQRLVIPLCGMSIGLIHGRRSLAPDLPAVLSGEAPSHSGHELQGFLADLLHSFSGVNAVIFGQLRRPYMAWHNGVLLFCPGAVFHRTAENTRAELAANPPPRRRTYLNKWLAAAESDPAWAAVPPSIGLLTVSAGTIQAEIIALSMSASGAAPQSTTETTTDTTTDTGA